MLLKIFEKGYDWRPMKKDFDDFDKDMFHKDFDIFCKKVNNGYFPKR